MKTIIVLLLITTRVFAQLPEQKYINILSKTAVYNNIYIAVPIQGKNHNGIVVTNHSLHEYYLKNYTIRKKNYEVFLKSLLKGEIMLDTTKFVLKPYGVVNRNNNIFKFYQKMGINALIKKYLNPIDGRLRNNTSDDETLYGLIQIMFDNKYFISFSQYSGYFYFTQEALVIPRIKRHNLQRSMLK